MLIKKENKFTSTVIPRDGEYRCSSKQLPKFCVGGVPSSGTTWYASDVRGLSPCSFVTNSIVPNNRPSAESRVSHEAGVKNAGSFRPCTTQYAQTVKGEGRGREGDCWHAGKTQPHVETREKRRWKGPVVRIVPHFRLSFSQSFRVYIAVLTSFSPIHIRGSINITILPGLLFIHECIFHSFSFIRDNNL